MRRAITFAAALAIRQNAPHVALEIVGTARQQHYVTVRNIKVLAFTDLGRPDDALPILKAVLQISDTTHKHSFTKDVVSFRLKWLRDYRTKISYCYVLIFTDSQFERSRQ